MQNRRPGFERVVCRESGSAHYGSKATLAAKSKKPINMHLRLSYTTVLVLKSATASDNELG